MIDDALRYMRVPKDARRQNSELFNRVISEFERLNDVMRPRKIWNKFPVIISGENNLDIAGIKIESVPLSKLLSNSKFCCLMAVTLGHEVDREILTAQMRDMSEGLILDACASVMADIICDELENEIKCELNINLTSQSYGKISVSRNCCRSGLTRRFSPGYGDVPLSISADIIDILSADKYIGLSMTRSGMMSPVKSITAFAGIIGIEDEIKDEKLNSISKCSDCERNKNCPYCALE